MKESDLWARLRAMPWGFIQRSEPGLTNAGVPDVLIAHGGVVRFVENKIATVGSDGIVRSRSEIRPTQVRWHTMFQRGSTNSFFMIGINGRGEYLLSGKHAKSLKHHFIEFAMLRKIESFDISSMVQLFDDVAKDNGHEFLGRSENTTSL